MPWHYFFLKWQSPIPFLGLAHFNLGRKCKSVRSAASQACWLSTFCLRQCLRRYSCYFTGVGDFSVWHLQVAHCAKPPANAPCSLQVIWVTKSFSRYATICSYKQQGESVVEKGQRKESIHESTLLKNPPSVSPSPSDFLSLLQYILNCSAARQTCLIQTHIRAPQEVLGAAQLLSVQKWRA